MECRNKRTICLILAVLMFISGMCFETVKADSLFASPETGDNNASISSVATFFLENDLCTTELVAAKTTAYVQHIEGKGLYSHNDVKVSFYALCADTYSQFFSIFFSGIQSIQFQELYSRKLILNYIHSMDGKKRF